MASRASKDIPIILTFLDDGGLKREEIEHKLKEEGFKPQPLPAREQPTDSRAGVPFAAVLVFRHFDETRVDKALKSSCDYISKRGADVSRVICCNEEMLPPDEHILREWGATKVVHPADWKEVDVADRVLAALFGGFSTSVDGDLSGAGEKPYMECWVPFKGTSVPRRIIGATKVMRELFDDIELYSGLSPDPVLIRGDTGTGKELVAAAIHSPNKLSKSRYITINIAELTPDLLPNELFGHSAGAFTGAGVQSRGLLAEAGKGTVFIDEIGDLDKENQARLLRVFSNLEVRPVGAAHEKRIPLNARLIFATHQLLEEKCARNEFRHDLYRRITEGHTINLRKLSERKGDLELLAKEFFNEWREERKTRQDIYSLQQSDYDKIVDLCVKHEFTGNVRALRGILRGCFSRSLKDKKFDVKNLEFEIDVDLNAMRKFVIKSDDVSSPSPATHSVSFNPAEDTFEDFLTRARTIYYTEVYRAAWGRVDVALQRADVGKKTFYKYCKRKQRQEVLESIKSQKPSNTNFG